MEHFLTSGFDIGLGGKLTRLMMRNDGSVLNVKFSVNADSVVDQDQYVKFPTDLSLITLSYFHNAFVRLLHSSFRLFQNLREDIC